MAIPLPGDMGTALLNGINTGSSMFSRIMQPILDREHQKQAEEHFKQQMALRKQSLARSGANSDIQRKILEQQLLGLTHKNDPMFELNQYKALEDMIKNGAQGGGGQQMPMPTQEMGEGMGMFSPEGLGDMQKSAQSSGSARGTGERGIDLELLKAHPMLRGFAKKHLGYAPLAQLPQTPEEKQAMALDLFKKKEAIKKGSTGDNVPLTTSMKTKLQGEVTGVDNSLPVIQELVTDFKNLPTGSETFNPSAYAAYNAKANSIIEPLINAFGLNVTDATKEMMHEQVFRKTNEPLEKYRDRLVDLAKEIIRRRNDAFKSLKSGAIDPKSQFTNEFFEGLKGVTKEIKGKKYQQINGEWYDVK